MRADVTIFSLNILKNFSEFNNLEKNTVDEKAWDYKGY